jgi:sporadic carbohydrate cluster 2OG-Fe(II) oxygenase
MVDINNIDQKSLFQKGWSIFKTEDISSLNKLRDEIYHNVINIFNIKEKEISFGLNNFHKLTSNLNDADLNEKKVKLIKNISENKIYVDLLYKSFEKIIKKLVGEDILVQKTINIVIQPPKDQNPTIPHRDAPPNSFYEIVLWIPLTDCYETKSMYVIDKTDSENSLKILENKDSWNKFLNFLDEKKFFPSVKYGEVLLFMPSIYHGSDTNMTNETRFSLNIRFKNLFTPSGKKFPLHFFRPYKISEFTKFAIDNQQKEILANSKYE